MGWWYISPKKCYNLIRWIGENENGRMSEWSLDVTLQCCIVNLSNLNRLPRCYTRVCILKFINRWRLPLMAMHASASAFISGCIFLGSVTCVGRLHIIPGFLVPAHSFRHNSKQEQLPHFQIRLRSDISNQLPYKSFLRPPIG